MNIFKTIAEDVNNVKRLDPAAQSKFIIWLTYPGLHARWSHVVEHWLWNHGLKSLARISSQFTRFMTGVEIHPAAKIGRRFFIDHAMGVDYRRNVRTSAMTCTLYQGVTLGGTGKESGKRHPTLGNNVMVGVNAAVLGSITIHDNSKVGGGAVVVEDVPAELHRGRRSRARCGAQRQTRAAGREKRRRSSRMPARPHDCRRRRTPGACCSPGNAACGSGARQNYRRPRENHSRRCVGFRITRRNRANLQLPNP